MRSRRPALILLVAVILLTGAINASNRDRQNARTTTTTTSIPPAEGTPPEDVTATLPASRPVRVRTGETVVLRVRSETPDVAKILAVGVTTAVGPGIPGELRFIAPGAGDLPVRLEVAGTTAGIVRVTDPQD